MVEYFFLNLAQPNTVLNTETLDFVSSLQEMNCVGRKEYEFGGGTV
jgi:hypothetical protein